PGFGEVRTFCTFNQAHSTDLPAHALPGEAQGNRQALLNLRHNVVREHHPDRRLALPYVLCWRRARLGVLPHVGVKLLPILPALILTLELQDGDEGRVGSARTRRMGHDQLALESGVEEVVP